MDRTYLVNAVYDYEIDVFEYFVYQLSPHSDMFWFIGVTQGNDILKADQQVRDYVGTVNEYDASEDVVRVFTELTEG